MSTRDLAQYIDKKGILVGLRRQNPLSIHVTVKDARMNFGRVDLLITPESGAGECWVKEDRVSLDDSNSNKGK